MMPAITDPEALSHCAPTTEMLPHPTNAKRYMFSKTAQGMAGGMCSYNFDITYMDGIVDTDTSPLVLRVSCQTRTTAIVTATSMHAAFELAAQAKMLTGSVPCFQGKSSTTFHLMVLNATVVDSTITFGVRVVTFYHQFTEGSYINLEYSPSVLSSEESRRSFSNYKIWNGSKIVDDVQIKATLDCLECGVEMPVTLKFNYKVVSSNPGVQIGISAPVKVAINLELDVDAQYAISKTLTVFTTKSQSAAGQIAMVFENPASIIGSPYFEIIADMKLAATGKMVVQSGLTASTMFSAAVVMDLENGLSSTMASTPPVWTLLGPSVSAGVEVDITLSLIPTLGFEVRDVGHFEIYLQPYVEPVFTAQGMVSYNDGVISGSGQLCYFIHTGGSRGFL